MTLLVTPDGKAEELASRSRRSELSRKQILARRNEDWRVDHDIGRDDQDSGGLVKRSVGLIAALSGVPERTVRHGIAEARKLKESSFTPSNDYIPEPNEILMGCRAWPPPQDREGCPVCGDGIKPGHDSAACAWCDSMSPKREAQIRAARIGMATRNLTELAEQKARVVLRKKSLLSECERRRIWNGSRGGILAPVEDEALTNRAKIGRDWLREINQMPDFSIILNHCGRRVGRYEVLNEPEEPFL